MEDSKQLARSSGSVGANYIEANDSLGEKDKLMKLRICKKEAKETNYWLRLIQTDGNREVEILKEKLIVESKELVLILATILSKLEAAR